MKTSIKKALLIPTVFILASCSNSVGYDRKAYVGYESRETAEHYYNYSDGEYDPDNGAAPQAGQLTCAAINDNLKYDYWKYCLSGDDEQGGGELYSYHRSYGLYFNTTHRVLLKVENGNDVSIKIKGDTTKYYVDNSGYAFIFAKDYKESYEATISYLDKDGVRQTIEREIHDNDTIDLENEFDLSKNLEIMFVVDATGSMGDEMRYIKAEIDDVIGRVKEENPESKISLAMMVYRDRNDEYVTRYNDFTEDIAAQRTWFSNQNAAGGGDIPEAVHTAMNEAVNKQWSTSNTTKLLFHIADASAHDSDVDEWAEAAYKAADKGIKIISVAASGTSRMAEYGFRSQSVLTGGQYVYLTDDSHIGNSHTSAATEEAPTVEYLNECMIRLINGYHHGDFKPPVSIPDPITPDTSSASMEDTSLD